MHERPLGSNRNRNLASFPGIERPTYTYLPRATPTRRDVTWPSQTSETSQSMNPGDVVQCTLLDAIITMCSDTTMGWTYLHRV